MAKDFYKVNTEREINLIGKSTHFVTFAFNTRTYNPEKSFFVFPVIQQGTFETRAIGNIIELTDADLETETLPPILVNTKKATIFWESGLFNSYADNLYVKNPQDIFVDSFLDTDKLPVKLQKISNEPNKYNFVCHDGYLPNLSDFKPFLNPIKIPIEIGTFAQDKNWKISLCPTERIRDTYNANLLSTPPPNLLSSYFWNSEPENENIFDGTGLNKTHYYNNTNEFPVHQKQVTIIQNPENSKNYFVTYQIDYDGTSDSHLKVNFVVGYDIVNSLDSGSILDPNGNFLFGDSNIGESYGIKTPSTDPSQFNVDYLEIHFFGYPENYNSNSKDKTTVTYKNLEPLYEDKISVSLLRTNPKLSGNIKITVDEAQKVWLNSFDANAELSASRYKKFKASSSYLYDISQFFRDTPESLIFEVKKESYESTKRNLWEQYDNFYCYGASQLLDKYYDEDYSFFAPLWIRDNLPEYFVIFKVPKPCTLTTGSQKISEILSSAIPVKTFSLKEDSELGKYIRSIVQNVNYSKKPLYVNYNDEFTYYHGISIRNAVLTKKGESLKSFFTEDRPIKEFEQYITNGFERNSMVCGNLLNLEFLFNDDTEEFYDISRYFGLYVSENVLAKLQISAEWFSTFQEQTPAQRTPQEGFPYWNFPWNQTNPNGILLPTEDSFVFAETLDPENFWYLKDRNSQIQRISEISRQTINGKEFRKIRLYDTQTNITNFTGLTQITGQYVADLNTVNTQSLKICFWNNPLSGEEFVFWNEMYFVSPEEISSNIANDSLTGFESSNQCWKLIATDTLGPRESWKFPVYDYGERTYKSYFSTNGTLEDTLIAFQNCLRGFDNLPLVWKSDGNGLNFFSKVKDKIVFRRNLVKGSKYYDVTYYERGIADSADISFRIKILNDTGQYFGLKTIYVPGITSGSWEVTIVSGPGITQYKNLDTGEIFLPGTQPFEVITETLVPGIHEFKLNYNLVSTITQESYFETQTWEAKVLSGNYVWFKDLNTSQVYYSSQFYKLPFVPGTPDLWNGNYTIEVIYRQPKEQEFLGTLSNKTRVQALIRESKFYENDLSVTLVQPSDSDTVVSESELRIGTEIIPNVSVVRQISENLYELSGNLPAGQYQISQLSYFSKSPLKNHWYQCQKSFYSELENFRIGPWNFYSIEDLNGKRRLELQNKTVEFYTTPKESKIVAWECYTIPYGLLSIFPVKDFDTNFYLSEYAYTPIYELFRHYEITEVPQDSSEFYDFSTFENLLLVSSEDTPSVLTVKIYHESDLVDTLTIWNFDKFLLNTYYPLYEYDPNEYPFMPADWTGSEYKYNTKWTYDKVQSRVPGKRNYVRRHMRDSAGNLILPTKFRFRFFGPALKIYNFNSILNNNLTTFRGFFGLKNKESLSEIDAIEKLRAEGDLLESFLRQISVSEYFRLVENDTKDYATFSIKVPEIAKWVSDGTDARENYYRLNTSLAFGKNNLSSDEDVQEPNSTLLTHEWYLLDRHPKDYPLDFLDTSRSYQYESLDTVVVSESKTWYELLKDSTATTDWFVRYFSIGYPEEIDYTSNHVLRSREERFTWIEKEGSEYTTLFRGAKILFEGQDFENWKFSSILRVSRNLSNKPYEFEVIKNDTHKFILFVTTVYTLDYRYDFGSSYFSFYTAQNILSNSNVTQYEPVVNNFYLNNGSSVSSTFRNYYPYGNTSPYDTNEYARAKQGFCGGTFLKIGDRFFDNSISISYDTTTHKIVMSFSDINLIDSFKTFDTSIVSNIWVPPTYNSKALCLDLGLPILGFYLVNQNPTPKNIRTLYYQESNSSLSISQTELSFESVYDNYFLSTTVNILPFNNGYKFEKNLLSNSSYSSNDTYQLEGGTNGFLEILQKISFASIFSYVNSGKLGLTGWNMRFLRSEEILKSGVIEYTIDLDKPSEYYSENIIGYELQKTKQTEKLNRHKGFFGPKFIDIIPFALRETNEISEKFGQDFFLRNTRVLSTYELTGLLRNIGISKVSDSEVLKISRSSSYQSNYPKISEVSLDNLNKSVFDSSWDPKYYRKYIDTKNFVEIDGFLETKEFKSFLGSKLMKLPKFYLFESFKHYSFNVIKNSLEIEIDLGQEILSKIRESESVFSGFLVSTYGISSSEADALLESYVYTNVLPLFTIDSVTMWCQRSADSELFKGTKFPGESDKNFVLQTSENLRININKTVLPEDPKIFSATVKIKRI